MFNFRCGVINVTTCCIVNHINEPRQNTIKPSNKIDGGNFSYIVNRCVKSMLFIFVTIKFVTNNNNMERENIIIEQDESNKKQKLETFTFEDIEKVYEEGLWDNTKKIIFEFEEKERKGRLCIDSANGDIHDINEDQHVPSFQCREEHITDDNKVILMECKHEFCYSCFIKSKALISHCPTCKSPCNSLAMYKGSIINANIHRSPNPYMRRTGKTTLCTTPTMIHSNMSTATSKAIMGRVIDSTTPRRTWPPLMDECKNLIQLHPELVDSHNQLPESVQRLLQSKERYTFRDDTIDFMEDVD